MIGTTSIMMFFHANILLDKITLFVSLNETIVISYASLFQVLCTIYYVKYLRVWNKSKWWWNL